VEKDEKITVDKEITLDVSKGPKEVTMPDLMGKTFEEAEKALKDLGFAVVNKNEVDNNAKVGDVVGQSVEKDEKVTVDKEITLDVSKGPKVVAMPNVVNESFENARIKLDAWGFTKITRKDVEQSSPILLIAPSERACIARIERPFAVQYAKEAEAEQERSDNSACHRVGKASATNEQTSTKRSACKIKPLVHTISDLPESEPYPRL
jgi:hypothetical protein